MIDLALPREHAALLSVGMERHCPVRELREGYALFRAGQVTHAWKDQFNIVHAIVRDGEEDRKLQLDLDFFLASECSCNSATDARASSKICAHMAAVFFLMYGEHDDPEAWLADVVREKEWLKVGNAQGGIGGGRAPDAGRTPDAGRASKAGRPTGAAHAAAHAPPAPEEGPGRPDQWGSLIDREMERLSRRHGDRRRIDIFYMNACRKLFTFAESLPDKERACFRLFAALRIMLHADRKLQTLSGTDPVLLRMVQDLDGMFAAHVEHEAEAMAALPMSPCPNAAAKPDHPASGRTDCAAGLAGPGRTGVLGDGGDADQVLLAQVRASLPPPGRPALDWGNIHRRLWSRLFADEHLRREEARRLNDLAGKAEDEPLRDQIRQCIAHLRWLDGDDAAAMAELSALSRPDPEGLAVYWETLRNTGSWARFTAWFSFALPLLQRADGDTFRRALEAARAYRDATGDEDFLRRALTGLLPRSANAYSAFLVETGRLSEWAHFHLLNGTPVDRLDRGERLLVEQTAPRLLLPLYHHGIERLLAAKNRSAYREIVRLAKRLKALYRTLGEEEKFHAFMDRLQDRNGRQHALMEELRKGNMLA